jgi:hypothetical protein
MLVVAVVSAADLAAAAAVVEVRARTAPALTALAQRLRDAAHEAERCNCCDDDTAKACPVHDREDNHE